MIRKLIAAAIACLLIAALGIAEEVTFTPGTYSGEATGMGHMTVQVTLSDTGIEAIDITENNETPAIGGEVLKTLPEAIVAAQSTQLDAVAGATLTSNALFEAVNQALVSANVDPSQLTPKAVEASGETEELSTDVVIVGAGGAGSMNWGTIQLYLKSRRLLAVLLLCPAALLWLREHGCKHRLVSKTAQKSA